MQIKYAAKTKVILTPEEWQLFDDKPGVEEAALDMNTEFSKAVSEAWTMVYEGNNYQRACSHIQYTREKVMEKHSQYGASDSEPRHVMGKLTDNLFNKEFVEFLVARNPDHKIQPKNSM